jgi:NAD/NADP transhydrogenase beta subunit
MQPTTVLYLVVAAAVLGGIRLLSSPRYAWSGNLVAAVAILAAIVLIMGQQQLLTVSSVLVALAVGSLVGAALAIKVRMIQMPQLVALLNGCGGAASALIALAEASGPLTASSIGIATFAVTGLAVGVGAFTFSGSLVAAGKLHGVLNERAVMLPRHSLLTIAVVAALIVYWALGSLLQLHGVLSYALVLMLLALSFGVIVTIRIGGADMPVVITFLNAASGLAASLCGFVTQNALLIACGAMVGASGILLSHKMCRAMNRSLLTVFLGFEKGGTVSAEQSAVFSTHGSGGEAVDTIGLSIGLLRDAKEVIIVPGYGMAVSQAQFKVWELAQMLEARGARVRFAIHPVAGRMPGHMNVLLAEAGVPYEKLFEMDAINEDFRTADIGLVVGACDVVNPAAISVPGTPISGMPILKVYEAKRVVICKRTKNPGYSGVENPLFCDEAVMFLPGDATNTLSALIDGLVHEGDVGRDSQ